MATVAQEVAAAKAAAAAKKTRDTAAAAKAAAAAAEANKAKAAIKVQSGKVASSSKASDKAKAEELLVKLNKRLDDALAVQASIPAQEAAAKADLEASKADVIAFEKLKSERELARGGQGNIDPATGKLLPLTPDELAKAAEKQDAFALIEGTIKEYGFTAEEYKELSDYIGGALINPRIGPNQMLLDMRQLPVYKARFKGNELRLAKGMNALSEANYVNQEESIQQYLVAGGVAELGTRAQKAELIGNAVSPTEVGKRINLAVDGIKYADPTILKQIKTYFPGITDQNLVAYFLKPDETLPMLQEKTATAQIGAAFANQGLEAGTAQDFSRITDLARYGVTQEQAIAGASNIKTVLPESQRYSKRYGELGVNYTQQTGEQEFLKSDAEAAKKRRLLASAERGQFQKQTGVGPGSLARPTMY